MTSRVIYSEKLNAYYRLDGTLTPDKNKAMGWYMRLHAANATAAKLNYMNYEGTSDWRVTRQ